MQLNNDENDKQVLQNPLQQLGKQLEESDTLLSPISVSQTVRGITYFSNLESWVPRQIVHGITSRLSCDVYIFSFLARNGKRHQADPTSITMREDPYFELGPLDLQQDFGFGVNLSEHDTMQDKINAIYGTGLFDEQMVPAGR